MAHYIIKKPFYPSKWDDAPTIRAGDRIAPTEDPEIFRVLSLKGEDRGSLHARVLKKLHKREVLDPSRVTVKQTVGKLIRKARQSRELTLEELAGKMTATKQYINRLEMGRADCSLGQLEKICSAMGYELKIDITRKYEKKQTPSAETA
jgi:ribosome-binding protein aMBF1 (putative translation factor)